MAQVQSIALPLELRSLLTNLTAVDVPSEQQWIVSMLQEHGQPVVTLLWRMLGSEQDVLDAYQTAVCQLAARGPLAVKANVGGYFYRTAMNAGIGILRSRRQQRRKWPTLVDVHTRRHAEDECYGGEQALSQREMIDQMRRAISKLPPHLRNVILLRELAELPYSEVAAVLGIGLGTARLYRRQAVVRLAALIGQESMV